MSLDKSAIQEIQKSVTSEIINDVVSTDGNIVVIPEDFKTLDLEKFMDNRCRFRGEMGTEQIEDFVAYVKDNNAGQCFVDAPSMSAKAFFNLGDIEQPGHGDNTAVLSLEKTAPFKELLLMEDGRHEQKNLAEWIEDWRDHLEIIDEEDDIMTTVQAVAAVRRITIEAKASSTHDDRSFGASRSAMEEVEAKSDDRRIAYIKFKCTPYEGLNERTFTLRVGILTGGDKPRLTTRLVQGEKEKEAITSEFKDCLKSKLPDNTKIYIGRFCVSK